MTRCMAITFRLALGWLMLGSTLTLAADAAPDEGETEAVSYFKQIRPIFQDRCQGCHQPAKKSGGFLMTSVADMQKGGDTEEPAFTAGDADASFLFQQIVGDEPSMPQDADPLSKAQTDLIRLWIAGGAIDDSPESQSVAVDMDHPFVYARPPVVTSLDYSPDGKLLAVSGYHEVVLHKADGSEIVARLVGISERIESAKFSPDGKWLAVTGGSPGRFGEVQIWDVAKHELVLSISVTYDTIYGASWSSDSKLVAFGCGDNTVRAIEAATGKQVLYQGAHSDWAMDTVFSTDNSHLVSVSRDMTMKLTEVATERFVDDITSITPGALKGGLKAVDRHPTKDQLVMGGSDGVPKMYKMYRTQDRKIGDDFNLIRAFDKMPGRVFDVTFNHDGSQIAAGCSSDGNGEARVYETSKGKQVSRFDADHGPVYAVSFSADNKTVAAAGYDGIVRLFEADTGKQITEFPSVPLTAEVAGK